MQVACSVSLLLIATTQLQRPYTLIELSHTSTGTTVTARSCCTHPIESDPRAPKYSEPLPCNSPVRAPCTEVPGPPFPAVAFSTTWNYIQYVAPTSRPTTRFATRIAPCGSACYCITDVGGSSTQLEGSHETLPCFLQAKSSTFGHCPHTLCLSPGVLPCFTSRSQGCFRQLHVSATTHNVSTRPTCF